MALPPWLPVTLSFIGLVITLSAFIWQVRRARFNQSIDLLFRLENDFFGPAKRLQRVKAACDLLNGQVLEAEPILDFFETMPSSSAAAPSTRRSSNTPSSIGSTTTTKPPDASSPNANAPAPSSGKI